MGGLAHRRRPVRRQPAGAARGALLRPGDAAGRSRRWRRAPRRATSTSTCCAAAPGCRSRCRSPRSPRAGPRGRPAPTRSGCCRVRGDGDDTSVALDVAGTPYDVRVRRSHRGGAAPAHLPGGPGQPTPGSRCSGRRGYASTSVRRSRRLRAWRHEHCDRRRGLRKTFGARSPSTGSTSRWPPARCTASSAPTAPASPPRSGCCSGCCAPTPATVRLLGGDPWRDAAAPAPAARLRAGRREPVAEPHRRRGDRPARPAARRARPEAAGRAARALRPRPDQEGPHLLARATGRRSRWSRRWPPTVELLLLDEPTSGLDPLMEAVFQRLHPRGGADGPHGAALQPHPGRGGGALRPGQHHPAGRTVETRHARRAAAPDPHHGRRRDPAGPPTGLDDRARGARRASVDGRPGALRRRHRPPRRRRCATSPRSGSASLVSHPPTLEELFLRHYGDRRRTRLRGDDAALVTARRRPLVRLALRRDRVRLPVWVLAVVGADLRLRQRDGARTFPTQARSTPYAASVGGYARRRSRCPGPPLGLDTLGGHRAQQGRASTVVVVVALVAVLTGRAAHPRRGGGRPHRAAPRRPWSGRHAGRRPPPCWSPALVVVLVGLGSALALLGSRAAGRGLVVAVRRRRSTALGTGLRGASPLVAAQVFTHARAALGVALARARAWPTCVRAAGDVRATGWSWLSPIGWSQATHAARRRALVAAAGARWPPRSLLVGVAVALADRRDVGAGLVAPRAGSPHAPRACCPAPVGLAWRLQRGTGRSAGARACSCSAPSSARCRARSPTWRATTRRSSSTSRRPARARSPTRSSPRCC